MLSFRVHIAQLNTVLATHNARSQFPPKNKIRKNIKDPQAQWANNNSGRTQTNARSITCAIGSIASDDDDGDADGDDG